MSDKLATRLVKLQRAHPLRFYVGPNGGGKTASAVASVLPSLAAGRRVLSTVRLLDWENPRLCDDPACTCDKTDELRHAAAHPYYVPLTSWRQMIDAEHCDILADEISTMLSSRDVGGLPSEIEALLQQCRKPDITFIATAPAWARADKVLREVMRLVVYCKPVRLLSTESDAGDRIWRTNRLFRQSGFDAQDLEAFENGKRENLPMLWQGAWWGPGSVRFAAYDTLESVRLMGARSNRGPCLECGLKRQSASAVCKGHDTPADGPRRLLAVG